jgi:hypothetical protein
MTDRPIIFSAPMVRALLDGRKTQTRRLVKPQPVQNEAGLWVHPPEWTERAVKKWGGACQSDEDGLKLHLGMKGLPYAPCDLLWVREAWGLGLSDHGDCPRYRATMDYQCGEKIKSVHEGSFKWRSPIHMPRRASRLTLIVTDVRVQRLQEISEADAVAEGLSAASKGGHLRKWGIADRDGLPGNDDHGWHWQDWTADPRDAFRTLWNILHGPDAWDADPWVVALTFIVRPGNIDQIGETP